MAEGAIVALLGANGAGKTTTLKAISSLVRAEIPVVQGGIRFRGESIVDADAAGLVRRGIVQVLEGRRCFAHLTVEENILSGGFVNRPSRRALAADLERVYTFQLVHLATLTGIGRAASADVARLVAERRRTYTHAERSTARAGPAGAANRRPGARRGLWRRGNHAAPPREAVQRVFDAHRAGDAEAEDHAVAIAELEVSQSLTVVSDLVLGGRDLAVRRARRLSDEPPAQPGPLLAQRAHAGLAQPAHLQGLDRRRLRCQRHNPPAAVAHRAA